MARVLIVTGRVAEDIVRKVVAYSGTKHCIDIVVTPIPIAAFLTTEYIALYLKKMGIGSGDYDYILLPGLARGSGKVIEDTIGIKAVKGTVNAYDLTDILKLDDLGILSPDRPADEIVQDMVIGSIKRILADIEAGLNDSNSVLVGGLRVPVNPPPIRVVAEIAEAHTLTVDRLVREFLRLAESGADIVSIGFEAYSPHPDAVRRIIPLLRRELDIPIAIDTSIPSEIDAAVECGADMVINADLTNIDMIKQVDSSVAIVTTPRDPNTHTVPDDVDTRVLLLEKAVDSVRARGFEKVFADAVLDIPLSTFKSILAFHRFKSLHPDVPMFMGVGNVVEMVDIDSVGVNGILTTIAQEVGVSAILTVEKSTKARGSTLECKLASQMASVAKVKKSPPKNIGIQLLILKDKKLYEEPYEDQVDEIVEATEDEKPYTPDPMGVFRIRVDHENGYIEALYIGRRGRILIRGRSAKAIRYEIASRGLISQISHALYLGQELAKAEIALKLRKSYIQDAPLFKRPQFIKLDRGSEIPEK
ncbi:MAG: dihydropteroate synthase-like protein [Ignisphaera sp.]